MADLPVLEVIGQSGLRLRVTFVWQQDRFAHRIEFVDKDRETPCLMSQEGDGEDLWPPSPPLQQLSIEEPVPGRNVALLVGMAGKSHWSVSVEEDASSGSLVFDVACRLQQEPDWLGSTYDASTPAYVDAVRSGTAIARDLPVLIVMESGDRAPVLTARPDGRPISLMPPSENVDPPTTVRWKYRVGLRE